MKNVSVITGGGSGMGFDVAKILGKENKIILVGRTVSKLENAINELKSDGIDAEAFPADISDRESVKKLVQYAKEQGNIKSVIHSAGVSPHMADANKIFDINAVGTININEEFIDAMKEGSVILNVASMAAYMMPESQVPKQLYELAFSNIEAFKGGAVQMLNSIPEENRTGAAYSVSKNFVKWYTEKMALKYGKKGIRLVSISPGTFRTPMGEMEGEQAADFAINGALGRLGEPEEIAKMIAFMVSEEASYLTAVDILYDGGSIAAYKEMVEAQQKLS